MDLTTGDAALSVASAGAATRLYGDLRSARGKSSGTLGKNMNADSAFLDFPQERTEFSDQTYAILGRALSYATLFEAVCRCLSSLQHIRVRVTELSDQEVDDPFALATQEI